MQGDKDYSRIIQGVLQDDRKDALVPGHKIRDIFWEESTYKLSLQECVSQLKRGNEGIAGRIVVQKYMVISQKYRLIWSIKYKWGMVEN